MGNSNNNAGNAVGKTVPWIALLVALAALGLGLWLLLRKPTAAAAAPGTKASGVVAKSVSSLPGSISVFDLREMSYFPRGMMDPMRESVNRVMARAGNVVTKGYDTDRAAFNRKLKVSLDKFEKDATRYTSIASLMG